MQPITYKTKNCNNYLYSPLHKELLVLDDQTYELVESYLKQRSINGFQQTISGYFEFLLNNKFLEDSPEPEFQLITSNDILFNISNVNQLVFEVTENCNLRCEYCGFGEFYLHEERQKSSLAFSRAKKIVDYLFSAKSSNHFESHNSEFRIGFYGGEPLLEMELIKKIVKYSKEKCPSNIRISFGMTTNGTLLERHIYYLIEHDFSIMVSLDGDRVNSGYRLFKNGKNSFKTVFSQLNQINQNHPRFFEQNIRFNSVLHDKNSIEELYNFFYKTFKKLPQISELHTGNINTSRHLEFVKKFRNVTDEMSNIQCQQIEEAFFIKSPRVKGLAEMIYNFSKNVKKDYYELNYGNLERRTLTGTCIPFSRKVFVSAKGSILPCEKIHHKHAMGYVDKEVYLNFSEIANNFNKIINNIQANCESCSNKENCHECLFSMPIEEKPCCNKKISFNEIKSRFIRRTEFLEDNPKYYEKIMNDIIIR